METVAPGRSSPSYLALRPRIHQHTLVLAAAALILTGAVLAAAFARPAVSPVEIQRRDRLSPAARFIPFAYQLLLNRAPDPDGLTTYQHVFDQRGPEAVAAAIAESPEFRGKLGTGSTTSDAESIARRVVSAYEASLSEHVSPSDAPGRAGFVAFIAACLLAVGWLQKAARTTSGDEEPSIHIPARYISGLFATLALMAWVATDLLLGSFGRSGRFVYLEWLSGVTALAASLGPTNVWTPYPQGTQYLIIGLEALAHAAAARASSDIWTEFALFRIVFQWLFLLAPSILTVAVISRLGRRVSPATATLAGLGAAFSFAPMYYGFLAAYVTEPLPVLLALVAVWCLVIERHTLTGCAIGAGAVLKLFPLLLLPVALVYVRSWQARFRIACATMLVVLAAFLPPALANFDIFMSPIRWQSARPPWESWYAFVNWLVSAAHEFRAPYFVDSSVGDAFGWVFWGITPRISVLASPVPAGPARWENIVSLVGIAGVMLACFTARERSVVSLVRWALFSLAGFMFWGIGWSPQYELYLVPFILVGVRPAPIGLITALAFEGLTLLEYPVLLPWAYFYGGSMVWIMWAALLGRYILLAWLCLYVLQTESSLGAFLDRLRTARSLLAAGPKRALGSSLAVVLVAACAATLAPPPAVFAAQTAGSDGCGNRVGRPPLPIRVSENPPTDADWPVAAGRFFSQAGAAPNAGFAIFDDDEANFWSEFQRLGGWPVLGYPATRRFSWHNSLSQATQRAVLQWSPVVGQVEFANVLDLLHELGLDDALLQLKQIPEPTDVDELGLPYETIAERRLKWLDARPAIKEKYCAAPGGADPVALWGLPTSVPVNMGNPGTVYVVRTQRAAFQEWVDGAPWAASGEVTVVLAGDLAKEFQLLPPDALQPEPAPAR
jgi:Glycosyltransferase family 87/Domain of unknown function (DUF4214)